MFNITGIDEIIQYVEELSNTLQPRMEKLLMRLMQEGYEIASFQFETAQYAGTNDVTVLTPYWRGNTLILEARGDAVAFIEFGTGKDEGFTYEPYPDDEMKRNAGAVDRGEYGKKHGAKPPWWYPAEKGQGTLGRPKRLKSGKYSTKWNTAWGNPPARAMYDASAKALDYKHIEEVAREVFR